MRPGFRLHVTPPHFLQPIVSNRGCGVQPSFEIPRLDQLALSFRMVSPDTGQTVGLQFHSNRQGVGFRFRRTPAKPMHVLCDAEQILNMVSHFMGNHIGLGEIAGGVEPLGHLVEKREIQIHLPVARSSPFNFL